jgi:hypothetical protein
MATPSAAEMMEDLRAADAAGDTALAQHIAGLIKASGGAPKAEPARVGMGDVQAAPSSFPDTSNIPVGALTGDPATDARLAAASAASGGRHSGTTRDALGAGAVGLGMAGAALPGALPAAISGALMSGGLKAATPDASAGEIASAAGIGGTVSGGLAKLAPYLLGKIGSYARGKVDAAEAKTLAQAAGEKAAELKSATSSLGGASQDLNRKVEWVIRLLDEEASGALSPANRKLLEQFRQTPEYADVVNKAAERVLGTAPGAAGKVTAKEAQVAGLQQSLPQDIAERSDQLLSPATAKEQLYSRLKRYWIPAAGGVIGGAIGGPAGAGVGMLAGRGASPSIQALGRMVQHPSWQKAMYEPLTGLGSGAVAKSGLPPAGIGALVGQEAPALRFAPSAADSTPASVAQGPAGDAPTSAPAQGTPQPPATSTASILQRLDATPQTKTYADWLRKVEAQAGPGGVAAEHAKLYERDPAYRQAVSGREPTP